MTTRELLRDIADRLHADKPHDCDVLCAEDAARAAALRAIADRFDAEERKTKPFCADTVVGATCCSLLARLDAPVTK